MSEENKMRKLPFIQTSVFIDDRYSFTGNQLATFYDANSNNITKEEMQGIALEMNFSESTFIFPSEIDCEAKVRIFTPRSELDFAGHPTLGTAFVLREKGIIPKQSQKGTLELGIGPIDIEFFDNNEVGMMQPEPKFLDKYTHKDKMAKILGIGKESLFDEYPMQVVSTGFPFLIVPLKSMEILENISLNPQLQLEILDSFTTSKILVFTTDTVHKDSTVHSRMFAPSVGVLEDPATGSAAGPLTAYLEYWKVISNHSLGERIIIEQGYQIQRPSKLIGQTIHKDEKIANVLISGVVKKTAQGEFFI